MIQNNNLTPLPFYKDLKYQHHNKPYAFEAIYPLFASAQSLMPFQFKVPHINDALVTQFGEFIEKISLVDIRTGTSTNIYNIVSPYIKRYVKLSADYIIYTAENIFDRSIREGQYYIYIQFVDGQEVYSEVITIVNNIDDYLKISWWDEEDLVFDSGMILYEGLQYRNVVYLCTEIGRPEYKFEEEGVERDGYFFAEKQISEKVYKFNFIAPEFLCDAMRLIRLSDNILIESNDETYTCDSFLAEVSWQDQGDLAGVEVEFRTNTAVKKIAAAWPK